MLDQNRILIDKTVEMSNFAVQILDSRDFRVVEQIGDGNCLYYSLSDLLKYNSEWGVAVLRQEINDYISQNKGSTETLNGLTLSQWALAETDDNSVEAYVNHMSKDKTWGGEIELFHTMDGLNNKKKGWTVQNKC